jgi:hypothetical protein
MQTYNLQESFLQTPPATQVPYGSNLSQPSASISLDDLAQSALLSATSSFSGQGPTAFKEPDEHVVASVRNLSLSETDLRKHCEEYLSTVPAEARSDLAAIVSHDGFWSFILKNRTGIGRIETPREPVSPELVENLTKSAWTHLKQDQMGNNAEASSTASSSILSETADAPFGEVMPDFPFADAMTDHTRQDDPFEVEQAPDAVDVGDNGDFSGDPLVD